MLKRVLSNGLTILGKSSASQSIAIQATVKVGSNYEDGKVRGISHYIEHLLFDHGYKDGMLGEKIKNLFKDVKNGEAPKWATDLDETFLNLLKDLGNGSIHPNDGNTSKQAELDLNLINSVYLAFRALPFIAYDAPHIKDGFLSEWRTKSQILKK